MPKYELGLDLDKPGEKLKADAANFLSEKYGEAKLEKRELGKKVDIYFEYNKHGKKQKVYVEAKDHASPLTRKQVTDIWADYSGIIQKNLPAELLIVTRAGISADAEQFVNVEQPNLYHRTIWELEDEIFQIMPYIGSLLGLFHEDGLNDYYINARARLEGVNVSVLLIEEVFTWLKSTESRPLAILAGYGAGKTSFARYLVSKQAQRAIEDPNERRPIYIKLGDCAHGVELEALLGAKFTAHHNLEGYNFSRFEKLNKKGRFLIVLDGFDEMKHAMSWADFRATVSSFNKLIAENAKVILMGRPSALTSEREYNLVIRGLKFEVENWRRDINWPEYIEYTLEEFSDAERREFCERYFVYIEKRNASREGHKPDEDWAKLRVEEVNNIISSDADVMSRPVHIRILMDMAADKKTDLKKFQNGLSRWKLYESFFDNLVERETEKTARKPISEEHRLSFLREIAFWLWTEKSGSTYFHVDDIPHTILNPLPNGDAADILGKKREYLTGAFLDKKSGDYYFFPHRSFAEYLVACRMYKHMPRPSEHEVYSKICTDGVEQFLREISDKDIFRHWIDSLYNTNCVVRGSYISLLAGVWNFDQKQNSINSHWIPALAALSSDKRVNSDERAKILLDCISLGNPATMAMAILVFITIRLPKLFIQKNDRAKDEVRLILCAILKRFFLQIDDTQLHGSIVLKGDDSILLRSILVDGVKFEDNGEKLFRVDFFEIRSKVEKFLGELGIGLEITQSEDEIRTSEKEHDISYNNITKSLPDDIRMKLNTYIRQNRGFRKISTAETQQRRKPTRP